MTTDKRTRDADAYRDLPYLLKPSPAVAVKGRRPLASPRQPARELAPPPPSAGFNPYFDLPPEGSEPSAAKPKGPQP